jgi:hypothetical protein
MKKAKKQVYLTPEETKFERFFGDIKSGLYTYTFTSSIFYNTNEIEHFIEVDVPETMREFKELYDLSPKELLEWLNKNYK